MKKLIISLVLVMCFLLYAPAAYAEPGGYESARLSGITLAEDGAFLVCDTWNKVIWRLEGGAAEIFAGTIPAADVTGEPQGVYHDGKAENAYFALPWDIVPFLDGYAVSDAGADVIRYIEDGTVYTLVGTGNATKNDGTDKTSSFRRPTGLATDSDGVLYVADTDNGAIRRVSKDGTVTTLAEGLSEPMDLCWYGDALYISETGRSRILRIQEGRQPTVFAGHSEQAEEANEFYGGYKDGPAETAEFDHPQGIAIGEDGCVYVADTLNRAIRVIRDGRVYTVRKNDGGLSLPVSPCDMAVDRHTLYVSDSFVGGILTLNQAEPAYIDVPDDAWYASVALESTRRGLINGVDDGVFAPSGTLTRAMFVTMLSRLHQNADGSVIINGDESFEDIIADGWYSAAARWAASCRIVEGIDGFFMPDLSITREQIATMLYRYAKDQALMIPGGQKDEGFPSYTDSNEISEWAIDAIRWADSEGIMEGSDGLLRPGDKATRSEATALLIRFMDRYAL